LTTGYDEPGDDMEDEEEELGPGVSDYDLSEEHGYSMADSFDQDDTSVIPQWAMVGVTIIVVVALVLPAVLLIWRYG
jgi:hypothetical protein